MYMCLYVYVHTRTYIRMCIRIYVRVYMCICIYVRVCVGVFVLWGRLRSALKATEQLQIMWKKEYISVTVKLSLQNRWRARSVMTFPLDRKKKMSADILGSFRSHRPNFVCHGECHFSSFRRALLDRYCSDSGKTDSCYSFPRKGGSGVLWCWRVILQGCPAALVLVTCGRVTFPCTSGALTLTAETVCDHCYCWLRYSKSERGPLFSEMIQELCGWTVVKKWKQNKDFLNVC